jgi:hypothetical protein
MSGITQIMRTNAKCFFSSPCQRQCELLPSLGVRCLSSVNFSKKIFRNRPIRNKNGLWQPCLLTNRDEMSILYRGPSIDASYQVSVHLVKRFRSISKKSSPLKLLGHMNRHLVGSIHMYGRFCIKFPQSRMKGERPSLMFRW